MNSVASPPSCATAEEYLRFEDAAKDWHEYWHGVIQPRPEVDAVHARLTPRVWRALGQALDGPEFECFSSQLRLKLPSGDYCYTDGVIARRPAEIEPHRYPGQTGDVLLNPTLIVEVVSPESEQTDRGEKLDGYRTIPSLTDYLLFSQDGPEVEHHRREPGGEWERIAYRGPEAVATLSAGGATFTLGDVYSVLDGLAG